MAKTIKEYLGDYLVGIAIILTTGAVGAVFAGKFVFGWKWLQAAVPFWLLLTVTLILLAVIALLLRHNQPGKTPIQQSPTEDLAVPPKSATTELAQALKEATKSRKEPFTFEANNVVFRGYYDWNYGRVDKSSLLFFCGYCDFEMIPESTYEGYFLRCNDSACGQVKNKIGNPESYGDFLDHICKQIERHYRQNESTADDYQPSEDPANPGYLGPR